MSPSYPHHYLHKEDVLDNALAPSFTDWVLATRVWVLRTLIVTAALVTVWRFAVDLPIYSASILTSLLVNITGFIGFSSTLEWWFGRPLKWFFARLFIIPMLLFSGIHMAMSSGLETMWVLAMMLLGAVILLDDPDHSAAWRKWLGSMAATITMFLALLNLPEGQAEADLLMYKRWYIALALIIGITAFAWHNVFYLHKYLQRTDQYGFVTWRQSVDRILVQAAHINPLFILIVLLILVVGSGFSVLLLSFETSMLANLAKVHQPITVMILMLMAATFALALKPSIKAWLGPTIFIFFCVMLVWITVAEHAPLDIMFGPMFLFLHYTQPTRSRWLSVFVLLAIVATLFVLYTSISASTETWVVSIALLLSFVIIFDRLRQMYLTQLYVLGSIAQQEPLSVQPLDATRDEPWFENVQHWYLLGMVVMLFISITGYYTYTFSQRTTADNLSMQLNTEIQLETHHVLNEFSLMSLLSTRDLRAQTSSFADYWCDINTIKDGVMDVFKQRQCGVDWSLVNQIDIDALVDNTFYAFVQRDSTLLLLRAQSTHGHVLIGVVSVSRWLEHILDHTMMYEDFNVTLTLKNAQGDIFLALGGGESPSLHASSGTFVELGRGEVALHLSDIANQRFVLGLSQVLVLVVLFLWVLRHFYKSRANYLRLGGQLQASRQEIDEKDTLRQELANALFLAEEANKSKDQFLGVIGHEIRTPLNSVMGMLQALSMKSLPDDAKHLLKNAYSGSTMLLNLVNDVLDLNKIQSGTLTLDKRPFALSTFIDLYQQQYATAAMAKGLSFKCEVHGDRQTVLLGDDIRLGQVLANLLSNAIKFTQAGGIILRVDVEDNGEGADCCFKVMDTGIGIEEKFLPKVFEPFKQSDMSIKREYRGAGLGLSIAKQLVEMMDGHIDVFSKVGRGSTFTVTLPMALADDLEAFAIVNELDFLPPKEIYKGKRILVVDDDQLNLEVITELLAPFGVIVDCALNANESFDYLARHGSDYAFVLMDHQMPDMTGLEQTYRIRESYAKDKLPIIFLTADLTEKVIELANKAGTNESMSKPITLRNLRRLLDNY